MTDRYEMECMGETVTMIVDDDGVEFLGWDEDAELAAQALGFEPSNCWIVSQIIKNGRLDEELLSYSRRSDNAEVVETLIAAGAYVEAKDKDGWTPLHLAAWNGRDSIVEMLLAADADVDARTNAGWTPLYWAARKGHDSIVEILLAAGADVDARSNDGWTPLHLAAQHGHDSIVEILLAAGAKDTR